MKSDVPSEPMIFLKPATAIVRNGGAVIIPPLSREVQYEVELVAAIGTKGKNIAEADALRYVAGYAVGIDMTARDIQAEAKRKGHPWSVAKGFDTFAPLGDFVPASKIPDPHRLDISLKVNGEIRQSGTTSDMIFPIPRLISYASRIFTLEPGDLLYTGTPEGVGPVTVGDVMEGEITGLPRLSVRVESASE